jgi:hypothetical protein
MKHLWGLFTSSLHAAWSAAEKRAVERESHAMKRWDRIHQNMQSNSIKEHMVIKRDDKASPN